MTLDIKVTWNVDGINSFLTALDEGRRQVVMQSAEAMAVGAQSSVRVETGSLHDTIEAEQAIEADGISTWVVVAGDTEGGYKGGGETGKAAGRPVDYAVEQEYGPGEHTPYMTPAAEAGWIVFQNAFQSMLRAIAGGT